MPQPALLAHDIIRTLGTRRVLDGVSLSASPGRRIGLIGENGAGKSTLLRLLAGVDEPDAGHVTRPADLGFLHQEMPFDAAATVGDVLDEALREARADLAALDLLTDRLARTPQDSPGYAELLDAYGARLEQARQRESWDADRQAAIVLDGLGLGAIGHERALGSVSGGQRSRLALAALLVRRPSALLLDEPTNHLDDGAAAFLEERLRTLPGAVVAASHDRAFLDAICTDLIDLDPAADGPVRFGGGYSAYQAAKRAERDRWERRFAEEQAELVALRQAVSTTAHRVAPDRGPRDSEKMGYGHRAGRVQHQISRQVRNAARRLEEAERDQVAEPPAPLRFRGGALAAASGDGTLVSLRDIRVPGRLELACLDVPPTRRLLVTGGNGAGKSTLLAVLAGRLVARGDVRRRPGLTVGLLAQDTLFERPEHTAAGTYEAVLGERRAGEVPLDSLGLLRGSDLDTPVGQLSVGQRRRLALALLVARPPELLLLDEPTNHLSPGLCDELEDALGSGPGAIVVATHDRWLRRRWQGPTFHLEARRG
ncbi:macrolide transport system ATP-binding/permease protein [Actinacidiphila yanglinensis]|uniref:Macrolide transport system ATP-binding/permease protein n=1 Tax=Actinacidiphila yanglinensis TaxID=310779 RepID=A0A1H6E8B2_9ACTN|nr:ABC-F family ATP-binding cassette domain-containing protein [Actinacidiphila yanglinensis]SEG93174.1 macrolide transport system ATP-binding/permease protein [Actinacidiphila yanglinensis]